MAAVTPLSLIRRCAATPRYAFRRFFRRCRHHAAISAYATMSRLLPLLLRRYCRHDADT